MNKSMKNNAHTQWSKYSIDNENVETQAGCTHQAAKQQEYVQIYTHTHIHTYTTEYRSLIWNPPFEQMGLL